MSHPAYEFETCHAALQAIQNGTLSVAGVTNETLMSSGWIWEGPIVLPSKSVPRETITAITYKGCMELCGDNTEMNTPETALGIITTWIFPLAILFSLPFDSLHGKKWRGTFAAVSNWLGSPQTALTAAMFNFDQIRRCHRRAGRSCEDTYYVLSCFSQFELPMQRDEAGRMRINDKFIDVFIYGLFRPLRDGRENSHPDNVDIEYTKQLLTALAAQLRLLRRRSVVPTMLSLDTFLIASVISVFLAFGQIGDGIDVTSLTLGLLYSWLPSLVIATITDRNPVSSERTAELMSRWLCNVSAIRDWKVMKGTDPASIGWWGNEIPPEFKMGDFIGQGRRMQYCGLAHAVLSCITEPKEINDKDGLTAYDKLAGYVGSRLASRRPGLWFSSAIKALFVVWTPILMAFTVAFTSPTVGIGCWSGSVLVLAA